MHNPGCYHPSRVEHVRRRLRRWLIANSDHGLFERADADAEIVPANASLGVSGQFSKGGEKSALYDSGFKIRFRPELLIEFGDQWRALRVGLECPTVPLPPPPSGRAYKGDGRG